MDLSMNAVTSENDWLQCDNPDPMIHCGITSERKFRLFAIAIGRSIWECIPSAPCRRAIETAELFVEGRAIPEEMKRARKAAVDASNRFGHGAFFVAAACVQPEGGRVGAFLATRHLSSPPLNDAGTCDLLRDIFGNPFRPVTLDPRWLSSTVLDLARTIYDERVFERMPILADALMDAGCESEEIIKHCQGPGPHVRGCWVVDLLLGKE